MHHDESCDECFSNNDAMVLNNNNKNIVMILPTTGLNYNTSAKSIQSALHISVEVSELIKSNLYFHIYFKDHENME